MSLPKQPLIALSAGDSADLHHFGYGSEHVDEAVIRIGSLLFECGARVGYGGALRGDGFTETLIEISKGKIEREDPLGEEELTHGHADPIEPLVAYQAWPYYHAATDEMRALLHGYVRFIRVDSEGEEGRPAPESGFRLTDATDAWCAAKALRRMRHLMAHGGPDDHIHHAMRGTRAIPRCVARVALGGKQVGWQGMAPGVAEEIAFDLAYDGEGEPPAVYLIGAFGGCVGAIARSLSHQDHRADQPTGHPHELAFLDASFQFDPATEGEPRSLAFKRTVTGAKQADELEILDEHLAWVRDQILMAVAEPRRLRNGLTDDENRRLAVTHDVGLMRRLIKKGLGNRGLIQT